MKKGTCLLGGQSGNNEAVHKQEKWQNIKQT